MTKKIKNEINEIQHLKNEAQKVKETLAENDSTRNAFNNDMGKLKKIYK